MKDAVYLIFVTVVLFITSVSWHVVKYYKDVDNCWTNYQGTNYCRIIVTKR